MADQTLSIYDIFTAPALAAYWTNIDLHMPDPMIGASMFPNDKKTGLNLSWILGVNNLPVALQPAAFDTKAPLRDRIGVKEVQTQMPFFREAMRIGEKDRQDIETLLAKGEAFARATIERIFDDTKGLIDGAVVQAERMRWSLLTLGTITITATADTGRDVSYAYNYDPDDVWSAANNEELLTTAKWTLANAATSTPVTDLWDAVEALKEASGAVAVKALMNSTTLKGMLYSDTLPKGLNPVGYENVITSRAMLKEFVQSETGLTITTYDKQFTNEQGVTGKYLPDGYVVLVPVHAVGTTWHGTTPEEFDLMSGTANASVAIVGSGIAVTTIKEPHPVNVETIVSEIVLPSFERMQDVYVLKAF